MYKLLIVEDEEIFRSVLPTIIDWASIGFEVAGVCENGFRALQLLETMEVDAILTDIRMPLLNGLELAMEVKSRYPKTKVTLFSAFNEFDYARKGLACGVYGYILKSDGEEEIASHFAQMSEVLHKEQRIRAASEDFWRQRETHFKAMTAGCSDIKMEAIANAEKAGISAKAQACRLSVFRLDEYKQLMFAAGVDRVRRIQEFIRGYLYENLEIHGHGVVIPYNEAVCVLWTAEEQAVRQTAADLYEGLKEELGLIYKQDGEALGLSCLTYREPLSLEALCDAFSRRSEAFLQMPYISGRLMDACELEEPGAGSSVKRVFTFVEEEKWMKEILLLVNGGAQEPVIELLEALKQQWMAARWTEMDRMSGFAVKYMLNVVNVLAGMGKKPEAWLERSNAYIKEIGYCETIATLFRKMETFTVEAFEYLQDEGAMKNRKIVDEAVAYIRANYAGPLSLEELAKHVNVHPVHVSRLFSKETGKTFKQMLTEVRMEEAKRLLLDINYRVYEISSLVGYEKPRYFSELFRSMTGLTPLEFREKMQRVH
ncbi:helix-turn-helix domain-containing protein [Paenibacillus oryzisoli]|uniref:response regulator transcription factor n=1 Tax=Paenibacillus oryzisoli TaxID=1850517 RepID=UPI003D2B6EF9